jgi:MFS family permease
MFNVGSIAGHLVFGLAADRLGRKPTIWMYYLGALGLSLWLFLRIHGWYALLTASAATGFFASGQFAWMTIYLPELFPTRVRGSAISLVFDSSRSIAALGPLLAGWLISSFGGYGHAAAMMSLIYLIGLTISPFAGPETRGMPLPS